ncbi:MAG: hypothetical protein KCHDKBKB_02872 [Elusimicrobia bacterium]|nr:hypothetical protein [Elusimicrobiota bacterium]
MKKIFPGLLFAAAILGITSFGTCAPINERNEFIVLLIRSFQTVSREATIIGDESTIFNFVRTLKESPIVEYAMFIDKNGVIQAHNDPKMLGKSVTDEIGKKDLANRDPFGLRLEDFKGLNNQKMYDASLPVVIGASREFHGTVRIGFKGLK